MEQNNIIPSIIRSIEKDPQLLENIKTIAEKFNLDIDQLGGLYSEIIYIIGGTDKSANFVKNIIERLEINEEIANQIATDVNKTIFEVIKTKMQAETDKIEEKVAQDEVKTVEKAGDFEVVKERIVNETAEQGNVEKKREIISGIENPANIKTEPMVDRLLSRPVSSKEEKVMIKGTSELGSADIYREKI